MGLKTTKIKVFERMNDLIRPKILIVDDTETNIDILVEALRDCYRVGTAMNRQRAIESAKRSQSDLILLDIMMAGINGFEVCQNLKQDPFTRKIPIIFITALDASEHKNRGPVSSSVFMRAIC
jgi:putative two-component system response regulator